MSLTGAKLICLGLDKSPHKVIKAKGRKFTIGYYINSDYVLDDIRAKGVHCEIECDAFGRVTIRNMSDDNPVVVNDKAICIKRALASGSHIDILGRKFLWEFPTKKCNELDNLGDKTPEKQTKITEQAPNSCPDFKLHRKIPKRLTVHRFGYSIQSDEEGNSSTASLDDDKPKEEEAASAKEKPQETSKDRHATPERDTAPNLSTGLKQTPKIDLIDCTENKGNVNTEPKKKLLSFCQQSDIVITSFSPRETGVRIEKSFTAVVKPTIGLQMTPKSLYSTPKSVFSDDGSRDFMDFSTPATSNKFRTHKAGNSSMHLIDFTSIKKLAPSSPVLKSTPKLVPKKLIGSPKSANTTHRDLGVIEMHSTPEKNVTCTPSVNAGKSESAGSVISIGSVESATSDSVIELSDDSSPGVDSAKMKERTPTRNATGGSLPPRTIAGATPKRTPQSLMKRALLTSAIKQARTPGRLAQALSSTPERPKLTNTTVLTSPGLAVTPQSAASTSGGRQSRSATTPTRKSLAIQSPSSPTTSTSRLSVCKRLPMTNRMSTGVAPTTSTPLGRAGSPLQRSATKTDHLHKVRKSIGGVPLGSHISKARKSLLPNKQSPPSDSSELLAKARKSLYSPIANTRSGKMLDASLSATQSQTVGSKLKNDTSKNITLDEQANATSEDLSRTFVLDSVCEDAEEQPKRKDATFSPEKEKVELTSAVALNTTFSPEKDKTELNCTSEKNAYLHIIETPIDVPEVVVKHAEIEKESGRQQQVAESPVSVLGELEGNAEKHGPILEEHLPSSVSTNAVLESPIVLCSAAAIADVNNIESPLDVFEIVDGKEELSAAEKSPQGNADISIQLIQNNAEEVHEESIDVALDVSELDAIAIAQNNEDHKENEPPIERTESSSEFIPHKLSNIPEASVDDAETVATTEVAQDTEESHMQLSKADISDTDNKSLSATNWNVTVETEVKDIHELQKPSTDVTKDVKVLENESGVTETVDTSEEAVFLLEECSDVAIEGVLNEISKVELTESVPELAEGTEPKENDSDIKSVEDVEQVVDDEPNQKTTNVAANKLSEEADVDFGVPGSEMECIETAETKTMTKTVPETEEAAEQPIENYVDSAKASPDRQNNDGSSIVSQSKTNSDIVEDVVQVSEVQASNDQPETNSVPNSKLNNEVAEQNVFVEPNGAECFAEVVEVQTSSVGEQEDVQTKSPLSIDARMESHFTENNQSVTTNESQSNVLRNIPITVEIASTVAECEDEKENQLSIGKGLPKTPNLRGIRELVKTPRNASPNFVGVRRLLKTPKTSADDTIDMSNVNALLKTPDMSVAQREPSKAFTPRRSARRVSSDSIQLESARPLGRTRSMSMEPSVETSSKKTPKRSPRRASMSAAPTADAQYTPRRITTRRMSMSRDGNSDDESSQQTTLKTPARLRRTTRQECQIEDMGMGAILEEDNGQASANNSPVKSKDDSVLDVFDDSDYEYGKEMGTTKECNSPKRQSSKREESPSTYSKTPVGQDSPGAVATNHNPNKSVQIFDTPEIDIEIEETQETEIVQNCFDEKETYIPETPLHKSVDRTVPMEETACSQSIANLDTAMVDASKNEMQMSYTEVDNPKDDSPSVVGISKMEEKLDNLQDESRATDMSSLTTLHLEEPMDDSSVGAEQLEERTNIDPDKTKDTVMDTSQRSEPNEEPKEQPNTENDEDSCIKTPDMRGMRKMLKTPKIADKTPRLGGVRDLLRTPKSCSNKDEDENDGIAELMATPQAESSTSAAAISHPTAAKDALRTPKYCSTPHTKGMRELFQTPKMSSTPYLGGVKQMLESPREVAEAEIEIQQVHVEVEKPTDLEDTQDAASLDKFFNTPRAKNLMIPQMPPSAIIEKSSVKSDARTEYTLDESIALNLDELFKTPTINRLDENTGNTVDDNDVETNPDEVFDQLVGQPAVHHTPSRKVYKRNSKSVVPSSPTSEADVFTDRPKTDVEEWLAAVEPEKHTVETEIEADKIEEAQTTHDADKRSSPYFDASGVYELLDDPDISVFSEALCVSDSESVVEVPTQSSPPKNDAAGEGDTTIEIADDDGLDEALLVSDTDSQEDTLGGGALHVNVAADRTQEGVVNVLGETSSEFRNFNENEVVVEKRSLTPGHKKVRPKLSRTTLGFDDCVEVTFDVNEEKLKLAEEKQTNVVNVEIEENEEQSPSRGIVEVLDENSLAFKNFNENDVVVEKRALTPPNPKKMRPQLLRKTLGSHDSLEITIDMTEEKSKLSKEKQTKRVEIIEIDEQEGKGDSSPDSESKETTKELASQDAAIADTEMESVIGITDTASSDVPKLEIAGDNNLGKEERACIITIEDSLSPSVEVQQAEQGIVKSYNFELQISETPNTEQSHQTALNIPEKKPNESFQGENASSVVGVGETVAGETSLREKSTGEMSVKSVESAEEANTAIKPATEKTEMPKKRNVRSKTISECSQSSLQGDDHSKRKVSTRRVLKGHSEEASASETKEHLKTVEEVDKDVSVENNEIDVEIQAKTPTTKGTNKRRVGRTNTPAITDSINKEVPEDMETANQSYEEHENANSKDVQKVTRTRRGKAPMKINTDTPKMTKTAASMRKARNTKETHNNDDGEEHTEQLQPKHEVAYQNTTMEADDNSKPSSRRKRRSGGAVDIHGIEDQEESHAEKSSRSAGVRRKKDVTEKSATVEISHADNETETKAKAPPTRGRGGRRQRKVDDHLAEVDVDENVVEAAVPGQDEPKPKHNAVKRTARKRKDSHNVEEPLAKINVEEPKEDEKTIIETSQSPEQKKKAPPSTSTKRTTRKLKEAQEEVAEHLEMVETMQSGEDTDGIAKNGDNANVLGKASKPPVSKRGTRKRKDEENKDEETVVKKGDDQAVEEDKQPKTARDKRKESESLDDVQQADGVTDKKTAIKTEMETGTPQAQANRSRKTAKGKNAIVNREDVKEHAGDDDDHKPVRKMPRRAAAVHDHNYDESSNPAEHIESKRSDSRRVISKKDSQENELHQMSTPQKSSNRLVKKVLTMAEEAIEQQSPAVAVPKKGPARARGKRLVSTDVASTPIRQSAEPSTEHSHSDFEPAENLEDINESEVPKTTTAGRRGVRKPKVQEDPTISSATTSTSQEKTTTRKRGAKTTAIDVAEEPTPTETKDNVRGRRGKNQTADHPPESQADTIAEKPKRGRKPKTVEVVSNAEPEHTSDEPESHVETVTEKPKRVRKPKAMEVVANAEPVHTSDEPESHVETVTEKPKRVRKPKAVAVVSNAEAEHTSDEPDNKTLQESPEQTENISAAKRTVARRKAAAADSPAVPVKRGRRKAAEDVDEATPSKATGRGRKVVRFEQAPDEGIAKRVRK